MPQATTSEEQTFLDELDKKLWNAAERLRANLDAAVYKHAVLGLIFLKYVSDALSYTTSMKPITVSRQEKWTLARMPTGTTC